MCRLRYSIVTARETNDASSSFTQVNIRKEGDKMSFLKKLFHHTHTYKEDTNMTNKDKALALINTFATGDTDAAKNLLAEGYIQHNTGIADGLSGLGAALEALGKQGIQMIYDQTYQVLADGNYGLAVSEVFMQNLYGKNSEITDEYDSNLAAICHNGTFVGMQKDSVVSFKGIPYAKAPIGFRQWVVHSSL